VVGGVGVVESEGEVVAGMGHDIPGGGGRARAQRREGAHGPGVVRSGAHLRNSSSYSTI